MLPCSIWLVTAWVFEIFFDSRRSRSSMFLKSMLPPTLSWYVWSSARPRSSNRRVRTRWTMVEPTWLLMSSPMIGTPASGNLLGPLGVRGDEDRDGVDEGDARVEAAPGRRSAGPARSRPGGTTTSTSARASRSACDHVDRLGRRLLDHLAVVLAEPVEGRAALDGHAQLADLGEPDRVVLAGVDGLAEVGADLGGVDVEGGHELDVARRGSRRAHVHETGHRRRPDRRRGSTSTPWISELAQLPTPAMATRIFSMALLSYFASCAKDSWLLRSVDNRLSIHARSSSTP